MRKCLILFVALICSACAVAASRDKSSRQGNSNRTAPGQAEGVDTSMTTAKWGPKRLKPIYTGPFKVDLVVIAFPDCTQPEAKTVRDDLDRIKGGAFTIKDYYNDYSQNTTYPVLSAYPSVYMAPKPLGYYCIYEQRRNAIGWKSMGDGTARANQLRRDALAFAQKNAKAFKKGVVTCYVYCRALDAAKVKVLLRPSYPLPKKPADKDDLELYDPEIRWHDPLWPCSIPQVTWPGDGGTLVHELGHVLGSPDYYHSTEMYDGIAGSPCLPWGYGPTGMAFDRVINHAFVPPETYPTFTTNGMYALNPRSSRVPREPDAPQPVLGCFIPSCHPNYMFYLEYVRNEKPPVGHPEEQGLLIHVVNVTFSSPLQGPPDLCYTYRKGDVYMKAAEGGGSDAYFHTGDEFTMKSDPAARIPPLIPSGVEITDIYEGETKCSFRLAFANSKPTPKELHDALLPRIRLTGVSEVLPTSMRPSCDIMYRGEPLMEEYGFTWDTKKNPTVQKNRMPLYHRDRWDARILGLVPGTTYYVRAYVRNANGITYSKKELEVKTPKTVTEIPPLITDNIINNFYITRWHWTTDGEAWFDSASAIIALMSTGVYYGKMPGGIPKGSKGVDIRKVHTDPADSRPEFRMAQFEEYWQAMENLAKSSGLRDHLFGKLMTWEKRCAIELKVRDMRKAFVEVKSAAELDAQKVAIRKWLDLSQPVWLVRENEFMPEITDKRYPLDVAIIDGVNSSGEWHVTLPLGTDRGTALQSGYYDAQRLMTSVMDAVLFFYRP